MDKFPVALSKSAKDFQEVVYPQIKSWFGKGKLEPVEAVTCNEMAKLLDQLAGIDAWYIETNKGIRGLASRIQYTKPNDNPWNTFTVRKERVDSSARTEFEKLSYAIKHNCIYPYWFCQAYISDNKLQTVARCKTTDLIAYITHGRGAATWYDYITAPKKYDYWINEVKKNGHSFFYVVPWDKFNNKGNSIKTFPDKTTLEQYCILEVKV